MNDEILTRKEAARYAKVSKSLLAKMAMQERGPAFSKVGYNCVRYLKRDLDNWLQQARIETND